MWDHTFCILQNKSTTDIKYCVNEIKSYTSRFLFSFEK
jgi:REP element-mobilizing transposase RayT